MEKIDEEYTFVKIPRFYMNAVQGFLTPDCTAVLYYIIGETLGFHRSSAAIGVGQLTGGIKGENEKYLNRGSGVKDSSVRKALKFLQEVGIIHRVGDYVPGVKGYTYELEMDFSKVRLDLLEKDLERRNATNKTRTEKAVESKQAVVPQREQSLSHNGFESAQKDPSRCPTTALNQPKTESVVVPQPPKPLSHNVIKRNEKKYTTVNTIANETKKEKVIPTHLFSEEVREIFPDIVGSEYIDIMHRITSEETAEEIIKYLSENKNAGYEKHIVLKGVKKVFPLSPE